MALVPHEADPNRRAELRRMTADLRDGNGHRWAAHYPGDTGEVTPFNPAVAYSSKPAFREIDGEAGTVERLALALFDRLGVFKTRDNNKVVYTAAREVLDRAEGDEKRALALLDSPETGERIDYLHSLVRAGN